jgi:uncharacterized protein YaiL (DUF2058 family)
MGDSLQDQLRALGLADGKRSGKKTRRGKVRKKATAHGKPAAEPSLEQAYARRAREEQRQADLARRRKLAEDRRRHEINLKIGKVVKQHRLNEESADVARNFLFKGRIRKILLTPAQLSALNDGRLGVVYLSGGYHLLESEHVQAVRALSPEHVPDLSGAEPDDGEFPVPDDLSW